MSSHQSSQLTQLLEERSVYLGKEEENMFFRVSNFKGKIGKSLFANPEEYSKAIGVPFKNDSVYSTFSTRVKSFLDTKTETQKAALEAINPLARSFSRTSEQYFLQQQGDEISDSSVDVPFEPQLSSSCWGDEC